MHYFIIKAPLVAVQTGKDIYRTLSGSIWGLPRATAQHTTGQWTGQAQTKILLQMPGISSSPSVVTFSVRTQCSKHTCLTDVLICFSISLEWTVYLRTP